MHLKRQTQQYLPKNTLNYSNEIITMTAGGVIIAIEYVNRLRISYEVNMLARNVN